MRKVSVYVRPTTGNRTPKKATKGSTGPFYLRYELNGKRVWESLTIVSERGLPQAIRCDNGPELTSRHFLAWCVERQIELLDHRLQRFFVLRNFVFSSRSCLASCAWLTSIPPLLALQVYDEFARSAL